MRPSPFPVSARSGSGMRLFSAPKDFQVSARDSNRVLPDSLSSDREASERLRGEDWGSLAIESSS